MVWCTVQWCSSPGTLLSTHPRDPVNPTQLQLATSSRSPLLHMEPLEIFSLLVHRPLKIQILNISHISWSLKYDRFLWDWKEGKFYHQHTHPEVFMATAKTQISPSLQPTFSLLCTVWTSTATMIWAYLESAWVTVHFPSCVFGSGNKEQPVSCKLQKMEENITSTTLAHSYPHQCRTTWQEPLAIFPSEGYSEWSYCLVFKKVYSFSHSISLTSVSSSAK